MDSDWIPVIIAITIVFLIIGGVGWAIYLDEMEENEECERLNIPKYECGSLSINCFKECNSDEKEYDWYDFSKRECYCNDASLGDRE